MSALRLVHAGHGPSSIEFGDGRCITPDMGKVVLLDSVVDGVKRRTVFTPYKPELGGPAFLERTYEFTDEENGDD